MVVQRRRGGVIFDLDGVLVDSEPLLFEAERLALAEHGAQLTPAIKAPYIGLGGNDVLAALIGHFGLDVDVDQLGSAKMTTYLELVSRASGFEPTARLARALHSRGVPLAIASGSSPAAIDAALAAVGLDDVFAVRVSVAQVAHGKPAPDVFLHAASLLGVPAGDCVVVEDAVHGVEAARAAGMRCIAIPTVTDPLDERFADADLLIRQGMAGADADALLTWLLEPTSTG